MEMKREVAVSIMDAMKGVERSIVQLDAAIRTVDDEDERKKMLLFIAHLIHDFHVKITLPIVQYFPDLHPDVPNSREY